MFFCILFCIFLGGNIRIIIMRYLFLNECKELLVCICECVDCGSVYICGADIVDSATLRTVMMLLFNIVSVLKQHVVVIVYISNG